MNKFTPEDIVGEKYGVFTVIEYLKYEDDKHYILAKCECGNVKEMSYFNLKDKRRINKWCEGCKPKVNKTRRRLKNIRGSMKHRCYNPESASYHNYGGKGIRVCDEWLESLDNFYKWAIHNGYKDGLTIDRIDSNKDYCPENCRWISKSLNTTLANENRNYTGYSNINGVSPNSEIYRNIKNIQEFAREHNLDASSIRKVAKGIYSQHKGWKFTDNK